MEAKIGEIAGENDGATTDELIEQNIDGFSELVDKQFELESQIDELMIDTKYILLPDLTIWEKQNLDSFVIVPSFDNDKNIEKHFDFQLLNYRDNMKDRLKKVKSIHLGKLPKHFRKGLLCSQEKRYYLTMNIDPRISHLYNEVVRCYVYGLFEATCALCRAVSETIAKEYIKKTKYKSSLYAADKKQKNKSLSIGKILNLLSFDTKVVDVYYKIGHIADHILHEKNIQTTEEETYETITYLQNFIKGFYKITDFEAEEV